MIKSLFRIAKEKGAYPVTVVFTDENGTAVEPDADSVTWTLTNNKEEIINSRDGISIAASTTILILLSGDDLAIEDNDMTREVRHLLVEGTYDTGTPFTESFEFEVENLPGKS